MRRKWMAVLVLGLTILACNIQSQTLTPSNPPGQEVRMLPTFTETVLVTTVPLPTEAPTPISPSLPAVASPTLISIDFLDSYQGWGIAVNDNGYVLRTVDGGKTWLNATPPGLAQIGYSASLFALDSQHVWLQVPGADFFSGMLYSTSDGGLTWTSNPVPFGGGWLQFLDAQTGRFLADRGAGAGSQAVEVFHSSDGGVTWISVFHNDPTVPGASNSLPLSGIKNSMTFRDANTGWIGGSRPVDGEVYLFVTHDGGSSWMQQSIPLPGGYEIYQYMALAPIFFGTDGFLPLFVYMPNQTELTFYTSHDGGVSWSGNPTNANLVVSPGLYSFADAAHGLVWDGSAQLFYTYQGGNGDLYWGGTSPNIDLSGRLVQLDFVTGGTAWALTYVDDSGHSQLYRSEDRGKTWAMLIP